MEGLDQRRNETSDWRNSITIPIYKKGDPESYKMISLLNSLKDLPVDLPRDLERAGHLLLKKPNNIMKNRRNRTSFKERERREKITTPNAP
ncbi:hypothetical protein Trydic_g21116 [Trypoxylus dichotomus]